MSQIIKKRHWSFVIYPESLPTDWLDYLKQTHIEISVSPLHDKDINPTGEIKKPHYHCIIVFSGPTTFNTVKSILEPLNCPIPIPLESVKGMYRYFTHKDNPEKAQYNEVDIIHLNGFNPKSFIEISASELLEYKSLIVRMIVENDILEYSDLVESCILSENREIRDVVLNHTIFFNSYLCSRRNKFKNGEK